MSKKKLAGIIGACIIVVIMVVIIATPGLTPTAGPPVEEPPVEPPDESGKYDEVTNIWVVAHSHDWDTDAEDDGIRVWINVLDENENIVLYTNADMPVKMEIYSTENKTYPWEPARLIYSGTTVLRNWYNDAFVTGAIGVKDIVWDDISEPLASEQQEYGLMYATVTLPNGRDFSARYYPCRIR